MKLIESFDEHPMSETDKTSYIRYRLGRIKHELWIRNRKNNTVQIDAYDNFIVNNIKPGRTCMFGSAGYYLEKVIPQLHVIEQKPIVKKFYPKAVIAQDRKDIITFFGKGSFDNFIVVNNRSDHWVTIKQLAETHIATYAKVLKPGGLLFYSFRDTQINGWNRLTEDHYDYFFKLTEYVKPLDLNLIWHDIKFAEKKKDGHGDYDFMENPDTTNGNIKFIFQYKDASWTIKE